MGEAGASSAASSFRRWRFGHAALDERTLELQVRGENVAVDRKPLEVLRFLLHHAGEVVTKDELLEAVWPGRILSDSSLTSCIARLREALDDDAQEIIRTQHGYGYRLIAEVKVESSNAPPPPRFAFQAGDHPAGRPQWSLVERLGIGGHGEVWLARHVKTREPRVFKFALDAAAIGSLKREITLYRLLHDALGDKGAIVEIQDWNLAEPPYFIETEFVEGGNLLTWAESSGGLQNVPLEVRLELLAQVADTLAMAHSVGVLHKDLKPSNILLDSAGGGTPRIRLADFGSGGVLDPARLEALGITRLGFTKSVAAGTTSGTPIYFAPEVVAGQPATVQADIYALGVILYQTVVGSFRKPLAPGWELDVHDDLLREDIGAAAAGDVARRLTDASELAKRLRSLQARRSQRAAEHEVQTRLARAQRDQEELRARKLLVLSAFMALNIGLGLSLALFLQARHARQAAESDAVAAAVANDFLNREVLASLEPALLKGQDVTVAQLLDAAASRVDRRFADRGEVAARVHMSLGSSYLLLGRAGAAEAQFRTAAAMYEKLHGPDSAPTKAAREQLARLLVESGADDAAKR